MRDDCNTLGIKKLNNTAYHPQYDGMVERFDCTLKAMLWKHAARFGRQWDQYHSGILWSYRKTSHESTNEKPSFLLLGIDCKSPTEAAFKPEATLHLTDVSDYREEMMLSLTSARGLACECIRRAQKRHKKQHDKSAVQRQYKIGEWVLVRSPQEEQGKTRKLSRPRHGPYRVTECCDPDVTITKVYFPQESAIQVHQSRVCLCPPAFPAGYYWYGNKRKGPG